MKIKTKFFSVLLGAALIGCGGAMPIKNVDNAPITAATSQNVSLSAVRQAILRAGATLGWQMKDAGPNKLIATLNIRTHQAVVEIPYTEKNYSIKYLSSINLHERDGTIHKNYNGWISNLTRDIDIQLANR
jgi:hypothetical protein